MSVRPVLVCALVAWLVACGARSGLYDNALYAPPDTGVVDDAAFDASTGLAVACPNLVSGAQGESVRIAARAASSDGAAVTVRWTVATAADGSSAVPDPVDRASTSFPLDVSGDWLVRLDATSAAGARASCVTRVHADPAIELVCPDEQSTYQGTNVLLNATARARNGGPVRVEWSVVRAPGGSMSQPQPVDQLATSLFADQLGDFTLGLTATDSRGLTANCTTRVHVDPDVLVTCPPDQVSRPFAMVQLAATARSRTGMALSYRWDVVSRPVTSTARLIVTDAPVTGFTFDVVGTWVYRFTATNARGDAAYCTTRAVSASNEAVRVELVWNLDRSCRSCNAEGGGIDIDLHLTDARRNAGRWATFAVDNSDCYYANCACNAGQGQLCDQGILQWDPAGPSNNPQLDIDHINDLPGPENINVLRAEAGTQFDVGVHFYGGSEAATPVVARVYCAGTLAFESESVRLAKGGDTPDRNNLWRVGRITVTAGGCTFERCGAAGSLTGCIRPESDW